MHGLPGAINDGHEEILGGVRRARGGASQSATHGAATVNHYTNGKVWQCCPCVVLCEYFLALKTLYAYGYSGVFEVAMPIEEVQISKKRVNVHL